MIKTDVIVVGVGGMGSAACYHLAASGAKVIGLEQFRVGHDNGSSHGETRMIRQAYFEHPDYVPLLKRAYTLWEKLEGLSSRKLFHKNGLALFGSPSSSPVYKGVVKSSEMYGLTVDRLSAEKSKKQFPMYSVPENLSCLYEPQAGFLFVEECVKAHVNQAKGYGAQIFENEQMLSYQQVGDEIKVVTNRETYFCRKLVITAGPWSSQIIKALSSQLRLSRAIQCWFKADQTHDLKYGTPCFAYHIEDEFFYGFPMLDGSTVKLAAHFSKDTISSPNEKNVDSIPHDLLQRTKKFIRECLPCVNADELVKFVPCIYTMTSDEHFIIDRHPENSHVLFAAGFSGHGFKFSSVVGEVLSDLALKGSTQQPIEFLNLQRLHT